MYYNNIGVIKKKNLDSCDRAAPSTYHFFNINFFVSVSVVAA